MAEPVAVPFIDNPHAPASGAYGLATGLFNFLKAQGFDFSQPEGGGETAH